MLSTVVGTGAFGDSPDGPDATKITLGTVTALAFDPSGRLDVRLSFDHRVLDGATAANALGEMEAVLLGDIKNECAAITPVIAASERGQPSTPQPIVSG